VGRELGRLVVGRERLVVVDKRRLVAEMIARRRGTTGVLFTSGLLSVEDPPPTETLREPRAAPQEPAQRPESGGGRVAYVGDSMGVGTSPHFDARKNVVGGRSSVQGVEALEKMDKRGARPDTVIFDLGTNDQGPEQLRRSVQRARRLLPHARIVMPTVRGPNAARKNALIRKMAGKGAVVVVPWAAKSDKLLSSDRLHATPQGYRKRAKMIKRAL
jgi:lysophospholipase L1-like esterase